MNSYTRPPDTLERFYGFGQLSVSFLRANVGYHSENSHDPAKSWPEQLLSREDRLTSCNLDVRSAIESTATPTAFPHQLSRQPIWNLTA